MTIEVHNSIDHNDLPFHRTKNSLIKLWIVKRVQSHTGSNVLFISWNIETIDSYYLVRH